MKANDTGCFNRYRCVSMERKLCPYCVRPKVGQKLKKSTYLSKPKQRLTHELSPDPLFPPVVGSRARSRTKLNKNAATNYHLLFTSVRSVVFSKLHFTIRTFLYFVLRKYFPITYLPIVGKVRNSK